MKTITLRIRNSVNSSHIRLAFLLIPLGCFGLSPQARAVCQQGCLTNENTVLGDDALLNNTGSDNTAIGATALFSNTRGFQNTAIGSAALQNNTTGGGNTATGALALLNNTTGIVNTATGNWALYSNTTGNANTASGFQALVSNTTGDHNTAIGEGALNLNTTRNDNTANSYFALLFNTTGFENTAIGANALERNTTGSENTASGFHALLNNTTGNKNIALGFRAGSDLTTGDHNIDIGNPGRAGESSTIRIGRVEDHTATFIAGIAGGTVPTGVAVIVNANGRLGTTTSSARYKNGIKPMDKASEAILALKPVTFRYKHELDPKGIPQFGLVAEEVEKVNPALVARDAEGKVFTVRYEAVNAMLLNEFLKEHKKTEKLEATVASLIATVKEQAAQIQKVSAQIQMSKPSPQTAANNQ
jgi:trimeric autotransporter adhesin